MMSRMCGCIGEERPVADAIPPDPEENQEPDQSQSNEEATD